MKTKQCLTDETREAVINFRKGNNEFPAFFQHQHATSSARFANAKLSAVGAAAASKWTLLLMFGRQNQCGVFSFVSWRFGVSIITAH
jgi:hypothetical protein